MAKSVRVLQVGFSSQRNQSCTCDHSRPKPRPSTFVKWHGYQRMVTWSEEKRKTFFQRNTAPGRKWVRQGRGKDLKTTKNIFFHICYYEKKKKNATRMCKGCRTAYTSLTRVVLLRLPKPPPVSAIHRMVLQSQSLVQLQILSVALFCNTVVLK